MLPVPQDSPLQCTASALTFQNYKSYFRYFKSKTVLTVKAASPAKIKIKCIFRLEKHSKRYFSHTFTKT